MYVSVGKHVYVSVYCKFTSPQTIREDTGGLGIYLRSDCHLVCFLRYRTKFHRILPLCRKLGPTDLMITSFWLITFLSFPWLFYHQFLYVKCVTRSQPSFRSEFQIWWVVSNFLEREGSVSCGLFCGLYLQLFPYPSELM